MPFKEEDVYWISNDGTDEINFLTAYPFRLWKYSSKHGFKLRYQINDWGKLTSSPVEDYRSTGPLCIFAKGKALVKLFNQSTQYLISKDTVITFIQKDALRSMPIGFNSENDLLIAYNTKTKNNAFNVGMITPKGNALFPADVTKMNADSIKVKYWYQAVCAADGSSSILYIGTDALYLWNKNAYFKVVSKSEIKAFENLFLYQLFGDYPGNLWLCTSLGVLQLKIEKNRFKQYFTNRQQTIESNNQARGIYADETGNVAANIWTHTLMQQGSKMQYVNDNEIKYALVKHDSVLYCGGFNLFSYDEKKNTLSKYTGGSGAEIWSMFSLNDSLLLLGRTNGFLLFNSNRKKFDSLSYSSQNIPEAKFVYRFFKSGDTLWAVAENGLYKVVNENRPSTIYHGPSSMVNRQWSIVNGRWSEFIGCVFR